MRKLLILFVAGILIMNMKLVTAGQNIDDAKVVARTIIGNSLRPPRPKNQTINKIVNDRIITWDQALASSLFLPETYIVTIKNASTGAVKRVHTIQLKDAIPAIWTYSSGAGDQSKVAITNDGSIVAAASTGDALYYLSQAFSGDGTVEWEVDSRIFLGMYIVDASSGTVAAEITNAALAGGTKQFIDGDVATTLRRRLLPASKVGIIIGNHQAEFTIDDIFWMRGYAGPVPDSFKLKAYFESDSGSPDLNENQAFLRVNVRPGEPRQFYYSAAMLQNDFGSTPSTVKVEIVQVSARGISSAIATVTG